MGPENQHLIYSRASSTELSTCKVSLASSSAVNCRHSSDIMGAEKFVCELCKLDYSTHSQFQEHFWSMIHHKQLENTYGIGKMHVCCLCDERSDSISDYAKHLIGPKHRTANNERRKKKQMQVAAKANPQISPVNTKKPQTQDVSYDIQNLTRQADSFSKTSAEPEKQTQFQTSQWDQPNSQFRLWGDNYVNEANVHKSFRKSSALQWNEGNGKKYYYSGKKQWIARNDYYTQRNQPYTVPNTRIDSCCADVSGKSDEIPECASQAVHEVSSARSTVEKEKGQCWGEPRKSVSGSQDQISASMASLSQNSAVKDRAKSSPSTTQGATHSGTSATAKASMSSESLQKTGKSNSVGQTIAPKLSATRNLAGRIAVTSRLCQGSTSEVILTAAPKTLDKSTSGTSSKDETHTRHNVAERSTASSDRVNQKSVSESFSSKTHSPYVVVNPGKITLVMPIAKTQNTNASLESRPAAPVITQTVKTAIANHILLQSKSDSGSSSSLKLPPKVTRLQKNLPRPLSESGCKDPTNEPTTSAAVVGAKSVPEPSEDLEGEASVTRIQLPPSLQRELTKLLVKSQGPRPKPNLAAARSRLHTGEHHQAQVVESPDKMVQQLLMKLLDLPKSRDRQLQQIDELKQLVQTSKKGNERARFAVQQLPEVSLHALESLLKGGQLKPLLFDKDDNATSLKQDQQLLAHVRDLEKYEDVLRASDFAGIENSNQGNLAVSSKQVDSKEALQPLLQSGAAKLNQEHPLTAANQTHRDSIKEPLKPLITASQSQPSLNKLPTQLKQETTQGAEERTPACDIKQPSVVVKTEPGTIHLQNHDTSSNQNTSGPSSSWASNMLVGLSIKCKETNLQPENVPDKLVKVKTKPSTQAAQGNVALCDNDRPTCTLMSTSASGKALDVQVPGAPVKIKTEPGTVTSENGNTVCPAVPSFPTSQTPTTDVLVKVKIEPGTEISESTDSVCLPAPGTSPKLSPSQRIKTQETSASVHISVQPFLTKQSPIAVGAGPSRGDSAANNLDPQMTLPSSPSTSTRKKTPSRTTPTPKSNKTPTGRRSTPRKRQLASLQEILLDLSLKEEKLHKSLNTVESSMRTTKELIQKKQMHFRKLKERKTKLSIDMMAIRTQRLDLLTDATLQSCAAVPPMSSPKNLPTPPIIEISSEERLGPTSTNSVMLSPPIDITSPFQLRPAEGASIQNPGLGVEARNATLVVPGRRFVGLSAPAGFFRTSPGTSMKLATENTANTSSTCRVDPVLGITRDQSNISQQRKRKSEEIKAPCAKKAKLSKPCKLTKKQPTKSKPTAKKSSKTSQVSAKGTKANAKKTLTKSSEGNPVPDAKKPNAKKTDASLFQGNSSLYAKWVRSINVHQPNTQDNPAAVQVKIGKPDVKDSISLVSDSEDKPKSAGSLVGLDKYNQAGKGSKSLNESNYDVFEISSDSENSGSKSLNSSRSRLSKSGESSKLSTTPQTATKHSPSKTWPPCGMFRNHNAAVRGMCLVDQTLYTVSSDCTARAYDINDFSLKHTFTDHTKEVTCLAVATWSSGTTKETYLVTGSSDHKVVVYNTNTYDQKACINCYGQVTCLNVRDNRLYVGMASGSVHIVNLELLALVKTLQCKNCKIESMVSTKSKKLVNLVIGYEDWTIGVHDVEHGKLLRSFLGHNGSVVCLVVYNSLLYSASTDGTILVHDHHLNKRVNRSHHVHDEAITAIMLVSKKCVITASLDGKIRRFNKKGNVKWVIELFPHKPLCITHTRKTLYVGCSDGTVQAVPMKLENETMQKTQVQKLPWCMWSGCRTQFRRNPQVKYNHLRRMHIEQSKQCEWGACSTMFAGIPKEQLDQHAEAHISEVIKGFLKIQPKKKKKLVPKSKEKTAKEKAHPTKKQKP